MPSRSASTNGQVGPSSDRQRRAASGWPAIKLSALQLWLVTLAYVGGAGTLVAAGSCREAQLCCSGRDSSCVVQKAPINAIIEDLNDKPCYCDHACLKLGDCCNDFKDHCGVLDCQVSDWGQWSECDKSCGTGMMSRTRKVLQQAQNGGKHCPSLVQKRGCQGFLCHGHHDKRILREMALLLPAVLSRNRHLNDSSDIRRNLRVRYHDSYKHNREQEYCVEFEVLKASKACHKLPPYNLMEEGDRITVRCDLEALIPDPTASDAAQMPNKHNVSASTKSKYSSGESMSPGGELSDPNVTGEEVDDEENMLDGDDSEEDANGKYDSSASRSGGGGGGGVLPSTTTTTTPKPPIKVHCRGEGLAGRITRWSALAAPSCRGKWLRLSVGTPKKCTNSQFIFV